MNIYKAISEAILFYSVLSSFSIGFVEISSKFSVMIFSKDQETLQNTAYALADYIKIALLWTIGTCLIGYSNFGKLGLYTSLFVNMMIVGWIGYSYHICFQKASNGLLFIFHL